MFEKHTFQFISFCPVYHRFGHESGVFHVNNDSHLIHVVRGEGSVTLRGEGEFLLRSGAVVAIPPFLPYRMRLSADFEMLNIHYRLLLADGETFERSARLPFLFHPENFAECEKMLRTMATCIVDVGDQSTVFEMARFAYDLVTSYITLNNLVERPAIRDKRMLRAEKYLKENEMEAFDVDRLAKLACLSKSQFNRRFRAVFALSPHAYWEKIRFSKVCLMLRYDDVSIAEVAESFGFSSPFYFSRWFKKMAGSSPSEFKKSVIKY